MRQHCWLYPNLVTCLVISISFFSHIESIFFIDIRKNNYVDKHLDIYVHRSLDIISDFRLA